MQGLHVHPFIGRALDVYAARPISYRSIPDHGYLRVPNGTGSFERNPIRIGYRPSEFVIARERNATLTGFRTVLTHDGYYLNDSLLLKGFDRPILQRKFATQSEGTKGRVTVEGFVSEGEPINATIDEPVLCVSSDEPSNWGSWLYRIVPKLIDCRDLLDLPVMVSCTKQWMHELLQIFFGSVRILDHRVGKNYQLGEVYIPSLRNYGVYLDDTTVDFYASAADRVGGRSNIAKLYLSRRAAARAKPHVRPILNEEQLIAEVAKKGFHAVELETLPIVEQIRLLRDAKEIICPGGSGLFNTVFSNSAEHVVDIEPNRRWIYAHHSLLKSRGLVHTITFGRQNEVGGAHGPWEVSIGSVLQALN